MEEKACIILLVQYQTFFGLQQNLTIVKAQIVLINTKETTNLTGLEMVSYRAMNLLK